MPVQLTVNLPDDAFEAIERIADEKKISKTEALRQVIDELSFLHEQVRNGNKLLLKKDKGLFEIELNTASPETRAR